MELKSEDASKAPSTSREKELQKDNSTVIWKSKIFHVKSKMLNL